MKLKFLSVAAIVLMSLSAQAEINVIDDVGNSLSFEQPVKRIISLAPHATELLFSAGASGQIIGTVNHSDFPPAAKEIPVVGGYNKFDLEAIVAMQPELIVIWPGGNPAVQIEEIKKLGFKVYVSEPRVFSDVAENIKNMGKLLGTEKQADKVAAQFLIELADLQQIYKNRTTLNVFYQVWNEPLITISNGHLVSQVIEFCGGKNIFGDLPVLAPRVSIEAIIEKDPDVIIAGMTKNRRGWLEQWQRWKSLAAVKNNHLYAIDAELVVRQTPRVLKGTRLMCEYFDRVRNRAATL